MTGISGISGSKHNCSLGGKKMEDNIFRNSPTVGSHDQQFSQQAAQARIVELEQQLAVARRQQQQQQDEEKKRAKSCWGRFKKFFGKILVPAVNAIARLIKAIAELLKVLKPVVKVMAAL
jgi:hypothetical protein